MVIVRVRVFTPEGAVHRLEELGPVTTGSGGLAVEYSERDRWVSCSDGERGWLCSGLPFEIEREELP